MKIARKFLQRLSKTSSATGIKNRWLTVFIVIGFIYPGPLTAQDMSDVEIQAEKVAEGIFMLTGRGGNIGLSIGEDGAFVIDDQFAPLTDKILQAIGKLTDQPVKFVVNTHWHGDHTGGNESLAGKGAIIVAHENVRKRLQEGRPAMDSMEAIPGASEESLPVITFADGVTFHWNDQAIEVKHVEASHTDGDSFVIFTTANVIHTGDVFTKTGGYPYIDTGSGGNARGFIDNARTLLGLIDENTVIIPGHGPLAGKADVEKFLDLMETAVARIGALKQEGKTLEDVKKASPMAEFDKSWGKGFVSPDRFIESVYTTL